MNDVYKFLFFALIFLLACLAGYYIYRYLNQKILDARSAGQVIAYAAILFTACAFLLALTSLVLVYGYEWLGASSSN